MNQNCTLDYVLFKKIPKCSENATSLFLIFSISFTGKMDSKPLGITKNPWDVRSLDEYLFYCCPECELKTKEYEIFYNHAVIIHELAKQTLQPTLDDTEMVTEDIRDKDHSEFFDVKMELDLEVDEEDGYDPISAETVEAEGGYDILDDEESYEDINIDLNNIPQFAIDGVKKETLIKYKRSWREFLSIAKVKRGNEPTKEDVELYFNCNCNLHIFRGIF